MLISLLTAASLACSPIATDGDSVRCGDERIRLLGIDAPEMGRCQPAGRNCVAGDPVKSRDSLRMALSQGNVSVERIGRDRYGPTLGIVWANGVNLNCHQLKAGQAKYVARWDNGRRVAEACEL